MINYLSTFFLIFSILYLYTFNDINTKLECNNQYKKPIIFNNFTSVLMSPNYLTNAFTGDNPIIVKNLSDFCYPNFDKYVDKDEIYLEIFNSFNNSNIIYNHFGKHITLHNIHDYGKEYKNGYIFHKDQLPWFWTLWINNYLNIPRFFPSFTKMIDKKQKHIVCSCKDKREVLLTTPNCTDNILKEYDNLHNLIPPQPIYIKNINKVLQKINKYNFTLNEFDCLFFNPYRQFHIFKGSKNNIGQIHFFMLGELSRFSYISSKFKKINLFLKNKFNRYIYQMKYVKSEKIN